MQTKNILRSSQRKKNEAYTRRKLTNRRGGEDVFEEDSHDCPKCKSTNTRLAEIDEKLESHSRRGNLKFYGKKERQHESNEDTEDLLRKFLRTDLKIPKKDEESIQFDRVHRVSARRVSSGTTNSKPATTDYCQAFKRMVNSKLSLSIKEIMFGIINNYSKFCSTLNHLVIIGKYFLYVKALNGKFYTLNEFVSLARNKISFLYMLLTACSP